MAAPNHQVYAVIKIAHQASRAKLVDQRTRGDIYQFKIKNSQHSVFWPPLRTGIEQVYILKISIAVSGHNVMSN